MKSPARPVVYMHRHSNNSNEVPHLSTESHITHEKLVNKFSVGQLRWFDVGDGTDGVGADRKCGQEVEGCFPVPNGRLFFVFVFVFLSRVGGTIVAWRVSGSGSSQPERD